MKRFLEYLSEMVWHEPLRDKGNNTRLIARKKKINEMVWYNKPEKKSSYHTSPNVEKEILKPEGTTKMSTLDTGHELHRAQYRDHCQLYVVDPKTEKVNMLLTGTDLGKGFREGMVNRYGERDKGLTYTKLLKHLLDNHYLEVHSDLVHSKGTRTAWENLAKTKGYEVTGYSPETGKKLPLNKSYIDIEQHKKKGYPSDAMEKGEAYLIARKKK